MVVNAIYASNYFQSCHNNVIFHQLSTEAAVKVRKSSSENMQQIYRSTPMPKCDFKSCKATLLKSHFNTAGWMSASELKEILITFIPDWYN